MPAGWKATSRGGHRVCWWMVTYPRNSCSVIQGGIGSGLLYLVYTNDLPDIIHSHSVDYQTPIGDCPEDGSMVSFVDDSTAYLAHKDLVIVSQKLTEHYIKIEEYMHSNKLVINSDKTHLLVMDG